MLNNILLKIKRRILDNPPIGMAPAGSGSYIIRPRRIVGRQFIHLGKNVIIHENSWIDAIKNYAGVDFFPSVQIGDDVYIGRYSCIISINKIKISSRCVLSEHVYITDNSHGYDPQAGHIMKQNLSSKGSIEIGEGTFIGYRAVICPDVTLGKNCVVGANSVVTKSFPDHSMVAGAPATLIKRYNVNSNVWEKV